jgi:hypothetical protein
VTRAYLKARSRLERQKRIEDTVTAVYLAVEKRAVAEAAVMNGDHEIATALPRSLAKAPTSNAPRRCVT